MKTKKILTIILIVIWMITVFCLSNQKKEESSKLSGNVTEVVIKTLDIDVKTKEQEDNIENVIRKLTHYVLYTIGGVLILSHINLYKISIKKKILITQVIRNNICNNR